MRRWQGSLIGQKLAINEFVAYLNFLAVSANGRNAGREDHRDYLVCVIVVSRTSGSIGVVVRGIFGDCATACAGNRATGMRCAGSSNAVKPDRRHNSRFLYRTGIK